VSDNAVCHQSLLECAGTLSLLEREMGRALLAILCGVTLSFAVWVATTSAIWQFFSAPADPTNARAVTLVPPLLILGAAAGAFVGSAVALLIARRRAWVALVSVLPGLWGAIGDLTDLPLADLSGWQLLPHPSWMLWTQVILPVPMAWLASRILPRRTYD
jgi:hypothetical protein